MAHYLGVPVSELLGEDASEISQGPAQPYLVMRYNQLSQEGQEKVMAFVEFTALQEKNAKKEDEETMAPDISQLLHRYVDEYGYSWPTACQVVNRMLGSSYTQEELAAIYREK